MTVADDPVVVVVAENPRPQDHDTILKILDTDNRGKIGFGEASDFAIVLKDPHSGETIGGLWAVDDYGWAFVTLLVVPKECRGRGLGSRLIAEAEAIARARGNIGIRLDTFEFQARGFYEKLGYTVFGELEGGPNALAQCFLKRRFT